jgi:hypothetical protein
MQMMKLVSAAMIVGAFGFGAVGPASSVASAAPVLQAPERPGHNDNCRPWCDNNGRGNGNGHRDGHRDGPGDRSPWWASNPHRWWDDRQGPPPWGWGPPPAYHWQGGPPRPFKYWGYDVNPVWDPGFRQWGIWLFGLWIPVIGIG